MTSNLNAMENHEEKQVGSNLTGAAIPAKPGHQRDISIETYVAGENDDQDQQQKPGHIENTDALLGDVIPEKNNGDSDEAEKSSG